MQQYGMILDISAHWHTLINPKGGRKDLITSVPSTTAVGKVYKGTYVHKQKKTATFLIRYMTAII